MYSCQKFSNCSGPESFIKDFAFPRSFIEIDYPAAREFFVLYCDKKPLGRLMANISQTDSQLGFIGLFEIDLNHKDQAQLLLNAATNFLKESGATKLIGPVAYNTWFPYRFKIKTGDISRHYPWEPHNPLDYPELFKDFGMTILQKYFTVATNNLNALVERTKSDYCKAVKLGYTFRSISQNDIPLIYKLSMEGFASNFMFEPITLDLFTKLYIPATQKADLSLSQILIAPDGREVGFFLTLLDGNQIVLKSATVTSEFRGLGLSNAMLYLSVHQALQQGCQSYISALMIENAQSASYSKHGDFLWEHQYALFQKDLTF